MHSQKVNNVIVQKIMKQPALNSFLILKQDQGLSYLNNKIDNSNANTLVTYSYQEKIKQIRFPLLKEVVYSWFEFSNLDR